VTRTPAKNSAFKVSLPLRFVVIFCLLLIPLLVFPQRVFAAASGSDDFNRADGRLGASWTDIGDGGLSISSQAVTGSSGGTAGDIRTGETYTSDQYSQVEITSTPLTGGQWIGPAVRVQNGGQNTYLGIYFWNSGSPVLRLYKRSAGSWIQLGNSYNCGPLAAGTKLKLMAVGSTISFLQDGVQRISVTDSSFSGGAPGIVSYGAATADNWSGGTATSSGTRFPDSVPEYRCQRRCDI
jgi:hypothetical protein